MNNFEFKKILDDNKNLIDKQIGSDLDSSFRLYEPLIYALDSGKRIRANLFFETLKMLGKNPNQDDILFAKSLEMVHAYSLVHDDLPAMDNDDFRRGKPSVHKKFGEDIAILTGDALLNEASSILFDLSLRDSSYIKASKYLFDHAGYKGMIEGQLLDLRRKDSYDKSYLLNVYDKKTADLFKSSIIGAALISNVSDDSIRKLESYAKNLGLAYQIQDDLLEETFSDELNILNVMEYDDAIILLDKINEEAKRNIAGFSNNEFLFELINYLSARKN